MEHRRHVHHLKFQSFSVYTYYYLFIHVLVKLTCPPVRIIIVVAITYDVSHRYYCHRRCPHKRFMTMCELRMRSDVFSPTPEICTSAFYKNDEKYWFEPPFELFCERIYVVRCIYDSWAIHLFQMSSDYHLSTVKCVQHAIS